VLQRFGKLPLNAKKAVYISRVICRHLVAADGFIPLAIDLFHAQQAAALPPIHQDPFDRMLIAQAQAEGLELITADTIIPKYGIRTVLARV
jgi:PIN domain nuclease of toxin-antitoxin system